MTTWSKGVTLAFMLTFAACETTTEIHYVRCATVEVFPSDVRMEDADSVRFSGCDDASWEGRVVRNP